MEQHFYCQAHKPQTPEGFKSGINMDPNRKCEHGEYLKPCGEMAEVVMFPKPLNYPKLGLA